MNNLVDIFLPIKGDRQPFQPGQPGQPTQADLERMKKKRGGDGFGPLPPQPPAPPPEEIPKLFGGRAVIMIVLILILIFGLVLTRALSDSNEDSFDWSSLVPEAAPGEPSTYAQSGFAANFPTKPIESTSTYSLDPEGDVTYEIFQSIPGNKSIYGVEILTYEDFAYSPDVAKEKEVITEKDEILDIEEIKIGLFPGLESYEYRITYDDYSQEKIWLIIKGNRVYHVSYFCEVNAYDPEAEKEFLDSFQLLE